MAACEVYVPSRSYSHAGPCQSARGVRRVVLGDTPVRLCTAHRIYVMGGGKPTIVKRRKR